MTKAYRPNDSQPRRKMLYLQYTGVVGKRTVRPSFTFNVVDSTNGFQRRTSCGSCVPVSCNDLHLNANHSILRCHQPVSFPACPVYSQLISFFSGIMEAMLPLSSSQAHLSFLWCLVSVLRFHNLITFRGIS